MNDVSRSGALFLTIISVSAGLLGLACYNRIRLRPSRYLIPEGYVGWIRADFDVKDAPPLPIEDGSYLIKFPVSGWLQTSTEMQYGAAKGEYYYYSGELRHSLKSTGWGGGGMIWGGFTGKRNGTEGSCEFEFIGTEEELSEVGWKEKDLESKPKVGPIRPLSAPAQPSEPSAP